MNKIFSCFLYFIIFSCGTNQKIVDSDPTESNNVGCIENLEFKEKYFSVIDIAEKYTLQSVEGEFHHILTEDFKGSLGKLSNYVPISFEYLYNYIYTYPSIEHFEKDKNIWLAWYEKNKCNNLKWSTK